MGDSIENTESVQLTLSDLRMRAARLGQELHNLRHQRQQSAVVTIAPGENPADYVATSVDELNARIGELLKRVVALNYIIATENVKMREVDGTQTSMSVLLQTNKELRQEMMFMQRHANNMPRSRSFMAKNDLVNVATFAPSEAAVVAKDLKEQCAINSLLIDRLDQEVMVTVPAELLR